ncbi:MAG: PAS domain-containing sensor histidine kinase [Longimicrobiales bacterium]
MTKRDPESGRIDPEATGAHRRGSRIDDGAAERKWEGEHLTALLVESVRDYAIFALDTTGHVLSWNRGAQRFKGYQAHEIIGQHFSIFYPPDQKAAGKPDDELVVAADVGRFEEEGWRIRKDGTRFWANVVITALRDESGDLVGFAKVTRDLTERRLAEQHALEDARRVATAEAANRAKSEFLAAMSHELRTPLNAIGGYVDLLLLGIRGPLSDEQRDDLLRVRRSHKHLLAIINDLLNFSRLEGGQVLYDIAPVRIKDVFGVVGTMIEPQATASRIRLDWADSDDGIRALADESKVEQILINLLSNALKFSRAGDTVSVACTADEGQVTITVTDTGIGIAAEKFETIFEPFVQLGRSLSSAHEGTGLGLAISRDLARAMNGELSVRSRPDEGSTFLLTLPRAPDGATADR